MGQRLPWLGSMPGPEQAPLLLRPAPPRLPHGRGEPGVNTYAPSRGSQTRLSSSRRRTLARAGTGTGKTERWGGRLKNRKKKKKKAASPQKIPATRGCPEGCRVAGDQHATRRKSPITTHLVGGRLGISPASNWMASMAGGAEFSFISQTSPSKIKYQGLFVFF